MNIPTFPVKKALKIEEIKTFIPNYHEIWLFGASVDIESIMIYPDGRIFDVCETESGFGIMLNNC